MEQLIHLLHNIPEYRSLLEGLSENRTAAVTGIGQINRSHLIAGLCQDAKRPLVILCQDDIAARRLQEDLKSFLDVTVPILPGRELTLYDASAVSRSWEQKRIGQLYALSREETPIQIVTWESLSLRTMPSAVMNAAAFTLEVGKEYPLEELTARLTAAGYNRSPMVEGVGQLPSGAVAWIFTPPVPTVLTGRSFSAMNWIPLPPSIRTPSVGVRIFPKPGFFLWQRPYPPCILTDLRGFARIFAV